MTDRNRAILLIGLVVVALAGAAWFQFQHTSRQSIRLTSLTPPALETATALPTATPSPLRVYISGAVQNPDVYVLAPGSIIKDALLAAGGAGEEADLDRINLAAPVVDGEHIYVPRAGEPASTVAPPGRANSPPGTSGERVNINTALPAELETLPGIGPSLAQRIVAHRQEHGPFAAPEDITDVSGIGPATFEKIRDLITTH